MSDDKPANTPDPTEEMLDELLDDLAEFFPGEMREEARSFCLDAAAAHPVIRVLAERVRERSAPERSGEEGAALSDGGTVHDKAGGDSK